MKSYPGFSGGLWIISHEIRIPEPESIQGFMKCHKSFELTWKLNHLRIFHHVEKWDGNTLGWFEYTFWFESLDGLITGVNGTICFPPLLTNTDEN